MYYKKVNHIKIEVKLANGDWVGYGRYFIYDSYSVPRYTIGIIYEVPTLYTLVPLKKGACDIWR